MSIHPHKSCVCCSLFENLRNTSAIVSHTPREYFAPPRPSQVQYNARHQLFTGLPDLFSGFSLYSPIGSFKGLPVGTIKNLKRCCHSFHLQDSLEDHVVWTTGCIESPPAWMFSMLFLVHCSEQMCSEHCSEQICSEHCAEHMYTDI